ncbi:MAG TPA: hypothetical protein VN776_02060 [Terracidiphilus sp.]|nr:hypothetical protein [Terracidiphilus sp.]
MKQAICIAALVCCTLNLHSQTRGRMFTDTMSPADFQKCGLEKLSQSELDALNAWMLKVVIAVKTEMSGVGSQAVGRGANEDVTLYDKNGNPVAYISPSEEMNIYLWSGRPVAYLSEKDIYGFNGKHLGWFEDGKIYDHSGRVVGTTAEATVVAIKAEPAKPFKQFAPFKAFQQFAPFQPFLGLTWAETPLVVFLAAGR